MAKRPSTFVVARSRSPMATSAPFTGVHSALSVTQPTNVPDPARIESGAGSCATAPESGTKGQSRAASAPRARIRRGVVMQFDTRVCSGPIRSVTPVTVGSQYERDDALRPRGVLPVLGVPRRDEALLGPHACG